MGMQNTETVAHVLMERIEEAYEGTEPGIYTQSAGQVLYYLGRMLEYLISSPRGEQFDAEVIRMAATVEAFLGKTWTGSGTPDRCSCPACDRYALRENIENIDLCAGCYDAGCTDKHVCCDDR